MSRNLCLLLAFAVLVSMAVAARGAEEAKAPAPGVAVKLTISVDEYDPMTASKGIVKCVVVNNGSEPVTVTLGYDGQTNMLLSGARGLTLHPQKPPMADPKPAKPEPQTVKVEPKAEQTVFELSLDEILFQASPAHGQRKWRWDWSARPAPPYSPIHQMQSTGFVRQVAFRAETLIGGKLYASDKVVLKIKQPAVAPR